MMFRYLLCLLLPFCSGSYDFSKYTPYPDDTLGLLNVTVGLLSSDAPYVQVEVNLPGNGQHFFSELQGVSVRNSYQNPLFHLSVHYALEDGLNIGCRVASDDAANTNSTARITDHKPAEDKMWCNKHCTHKGRYCPVLGEKELEKQTHQKGHDIVMEITRRLCLGKVMELHFASPHWFEYVNAFEEDNCTKAEDMTKCSHRHLNKLKGVPTGPNSGFAQCVMEADVDMDKAHPLLEKSLDFERRRMDNTATDKPILKIGGKKFTEKPKTDMILEEWCGHFQGDVKPVACDFCTGCSNVKNCLWHLKCDSQPFSLETYKTPKHSWGLQALEEEVKSMGRGGANVLGICIGIGLAVAVLLCCMVRYKRSRAVAEVHKELPHDGFKDDVPVDTLTDVDLPDADLPDADATTPDVPEIL